VARISNSVIDQRYRRANFLFPKFFLKFLLPTRFFLHYKDREIKNQNVFIRQIYNILFSEIKKYEQKESFNNERMIKMRKNKIIAAEEKYETVIESEK